MALDETQRAAVEAARRTKAERDAAATDDRELREVAVEELIAECVAATKGKLDEDFAIVSSRYGVFAIRKPDDQGLMAWERGIKDSDKVTNDWLTTVLRHYIMPDKSRGIEWARIVAEKPVVLHDTVRAWVVLMGLEEEARVKK